MKAHTPAAAFSNRLHRGMRCIRTWLVGLRMSSRRTARRNAPPPAIAVRQSSMPIVSARTTLARMLSQRCAYLFAALLLLLVTLRF
jgi:hypothetical protein